MSALCHALLACERPACEQTACERESGVHPTVPGFDAMALGDDLRTALARLCDDDDPPRARVWSIAPVPRGARARTLRRSYFPSEPPPLLRSALPAAM